MAATVRYRDVDVGTHRPTVRDEQWDYALPTESGDLPNSSSRRPEPQTQSSSRYQRFDFTDDSLSGAMDSENSRWIHRDKLAEIEKEEMQAAGISSEEDNPRRPTSRIPISKTLDHADGLHKRHASGSLGSRRVKDGHARVLSDSVRSNRSSKSEGASRTHKASFSTSPSIRPRSRVGLEPRPSTGVNRPEGEAPWLATMYKPDPMLPQDQQIIPTHAKRQQQSQWDQAQRDSEARQAQRKLKDEPSQMHEDWPLPSSPQQQSSPNKPDARPGTSRGSTEVQARISGGYSAMPRILPSPRGSPAQPRPVSVDVPKLTSKASPNEKRDKCLACCTIM